MSQLVSVAPPAWSPVPSPPSPPARPGPSAVPLGRPVRRRWGVPLLLVAGVVIVVGLIALHDTVRFYRVTSGSMQPTLAVGARVAAEPGLPLRIGEIVVFDSPRGALPNIPVCGANGEGSGFSTPCGLATLGTSSTVLVKRIVAGPGDLVSVRAGRAIVNGVPSSEPFAAPCAEDPDCTFPEAVRVPAGQYFLLGDNRGASDDSRFWGPVPASAILGVAVRCHLLQTACTPVP
jgi:signal peptidase I